MGSARPPIGHTVLYRPIIFADGFRTPIAGDTSKPLDRGMLKAHIWVAVLPLYFDILDLGLTWLAGCGVPDQQE